MTRGDDLDSLNERAFDQLNETRLEDQSRVKNGSGIKPYPVQSSNNEGTQKDIEVENLDTTIKVERACLNLRVMHWNLLSETRA